MSSSRSAYSAFSEVDDLVSKPVLGSDGAASWQDFKAKQHKSAASPSSGTAPHLPVKRSDRLGTGLTSIAEERKHEDDVRRKAGDAPLGSGYTEFKKRGPDAEEAAARKRAKLIAERVRPDEKKYFLKAETFEGWKEDYVFTTRDRGTGYYWDGMDGVKRQMGLPVGVGQAAADEQDTHNVGEEGTREKGKKKKKKKRKDKAGDAREVAEVVDDSNNPMEQVAAALRRRDEALRRPPGAIAAVAAPTPDPTVANDDIAGRLAAAGWESALDPSSGRTYYFNRGAGERSWTNPLKGNVATTTAVVTADGAAASSKAEDTVGSDGSGKEDAAALPTGWRSTKDPTTGKMYYHHTSGKTSWERPTA